MWKRSITLRLTAYYAAASAVVLLAVGYLVGISLEKHFEQEDLRQLNPKLEFATLAVSRSQSMSDLERLAQDLRTILAGHSGDLFVVVAANGSRIAATDGMEFPRALQPVAESDGQTVATWREGDRLFRGVAVSAATRIPGVPSVRIAAVLDIGHHEMFMAEFERELWLAVGLSILAAAALGWAVTRRGLAPVRSMAALARGITASRLKDRLSPEEVPSELSELAHAFNEMLARLDESFARLSEFSSDLAHEMRTPIANLMMETQVSLSRSRSADEYREVLYSNLEELDRLARMASDMLYLAKADKGLVPPVREPVPLHSEVLQLFDFYEALAHEAGVKLALQGEATLQGDKGMVRRALSNLLSNAIRHTPRDGSVRVSLRPEAQGTRVEVSNTGSGIAAQDLPRIFERFYRADGSARGPDGGSGLGLAITKAIVEAHGGSISAASGPAATVFSMVFPAGAA